MPSDPNDPGREAERLFVEHVLRGGKPQDLAELRGRHPTLARDLEMLAQRWASAVQGASLIDRLRQRHGPTVDLEVSLEQPSGTSAVKEAGREPRGAPTPAAGPASSAFARLAAHAGSAARYRLEGEIGRGGMGAVLKVWDEDLRRTLAMKVALPSANEERDSSSTSARLLNRFLEEAQITGQLDHPGIVPVHELGLDAQGRVYFTMRLVRGRDLERVFELARTGEEGWTRTRVLGVLLKVCEAMAFAHEKGVIHRDLKPANVMVGRFGETYVMDWGLARVLGRQDTHDVRLRKPEAALSIVRTERTEEREAGVRKAGERTPSSPLVTMDGDVLGTPCYMAPEQARGRLEEIGPSSDVYAVGSMLYQLLTARMPYVRPQEKSSPQAVLEALLSGPPEPIHAIDRSVPEELVAIAEKAMARESVQRYPTMLAMAEDLRAYLEDRVVRAHESGPLAEFKKWIRRNRGAAIASAAAVVLTLAGLATVVLVQARANTDLVAANQEIKEARDAALVSEDAALAAKTELEATNVELSAARDEADTPAREARLSEYAANVAAAAASLRLSATSDARRRLELCEPELRGWEWQHLELASDPSVRELGDERQQVRSLAVHPGGELLAAIGDDGVLRLIRVDDGAVALSIQAGDVLPSVLAFTADGGRVACAGRDRAIHLWDVESGEEAGTFGAHEQPVTDLAFAEEERAVTASVDKILRLWDLESGQLVRELAGHRGTVTSVAVGRGGDLIASGSRDRTVRLWDARSGDTLRELSGSEFSVAFVALDPEGSRVAAGFTAFQLEIDEIVSRGANTVSLWSVDDGVLLGAFSGPSQALSTGAFSPDGRWLLASSRDSRVWLWDLLAGRDQVLLGHSRAVTDAAFLPDGVRIASCSEDDRVKLWNPEVQHGLPLRGHSGVLSGLAFSGRGERLVTSASDRTLRVWSTRTGLVEGVLRGHRGVVTELAVSPDGTRVAAKGDDGTIRLWELDSGRELAHLGEPDTGLFRVRSPMGLEFHPHGRSLAYGGQGGKITLWNVDSGAVERQLEIEADFSLALRWSQDGARLAVAGQRIKPRRTELFVLEAATGAILARRESDSDLGDLSWSPSGDQLALSSGHSVYLLDPANAGELRKLEGHEATPGTLAFTPDGRRLASGSGDETLRVWDLETGEALLTLRSPGAGVVDLQFSPDGSQLAAAYSDWTAFLWSTNPSSERESARGAEIAARAAALALLDPLFERFADPETVVERLRSDPGVPAERLRTAAVLARLVPTAPGAAERECWRALHLPGQPAEDLHQSLWAAQVADRLAPEDEGTLSLLGATQYRLGRLEEAAATLERSRALRQNRGRVEVAAFLAMACHRLGDVDGAQRALAELHTLMQVPVVLTQSANQALMREAEGVLKLPPGKR